MQREDQPPEPEDVQERVGVGRGQEVGADGLVLEQTRQPGDQREVLRGAVGRHADHEEKVDGRIRPLKREPPARCGPRP